MFDDLGESETKFGSCYTAGTGKRYTEYLLPKDLTLTLVSGYSIPLRHKIISRWQELETQLSVTALPDFSDPAAAAHAWATQYEQTQIAQQQVQQRLPAARVGELAVFHNRRITEVAHRLQGVNSRMTQKDLSGSNQVMSEAACRCPSSPPSADRQRPSVHLRCPHG
ncbi:hypothetical protein V1T76_17380 [Roseibium sp. FZY0029]|uniref:hypothetical protein n=1 Tax=Roseibium sp. FZY0029 TaxID=3116647 RepID=UPI002ECC018F|nr:hypothetical protein [Roseibium sp. FZY0029]